MKIAMYEIDTSVPALCGLGLSYGVTSDVSMQELDKDELLRFRLLKRANILAPMGNGHNKFLRMMVVYLDITASMYWWKQMDTYKVGTVTQSESTMHTLLNNRITSSMFEGGLCFPAVFALEMLRKHRKFDVLNKYLPQSFLQRRIVMCNYAVLRNIIAQRKNHKLKEWRTFCDCVSENVIYRDFLKQD